jgi:type 1 glutamine amidotransferase
MVWGGWDGHEPEQSVERFAPFLQAHGFDVRISDSLDIYADVDAMASVDLIVQSVSMGTITAEQERGLMAAVRRGAGLAGWHGGLTDTFRANLGYHYMVGGYFVHRPDGLQHFRVTISDPDDPITAGIPDFEMCAEKYYLLVDPCNHVLATTTFTSADELAPTGDCVMPVVWKRTFGAGRVFYASYGHGVTEFTMPEANEIMKRGLLWAGDALALQGSHA